MFQGWIPRRCFFIIGTLLNQKVQEGSCKGEMVTLEPIMVYFGIWQKKCSLIKNLYIFIIVKIKKHIFMYFSLPWRGFWSWLFLTSSITWRICRMWCCDTTRRLRDGTSDIYRSISNRSNYCWSYFIDVNTFFSVQKSR